MASIIKPSRFNLTLPRVFRSKQDVFESINTIDDFLENINEDGTYKGVKPNDTLPVSLEHPKTIEDAQQIVYIYETVYKGTYPFVEMLNAQWIYESFSNPNYIWGVIRIKKEDDENHGKIAGCYTWIMDFKKRVAYNRGYNILPQYWGKLGAQEIAYAMIKKIMEQTKGKIDKWYNECVTDHSKTQWMSHGSGGI